MRAPPLARIPDVAAPRPDAEPVTITHKPSFDIRFLLLFEPCLSRLNPLRAVPYRPAKRETPLRGIEACQPRKVGRHPCLSGGWLFPIMRCKNGHQKCQSRTGNAVSESENIV